MYERAHSFEELKKKTHSLSGLLHLHPDKMVAWITLVIAAALSVEVSSQKIGDLQTVAGWVQVEYDWDSDGQKQEALADGTYIPKNNIIAGVKVHKDVVYVTVPRWLLGVPSTMNTLVFKGGLPYLKPFPNWDMQKIDDCNVFQFTQSMEIVPHTDEMWIIDVGRRNIWNETVNKCPPKLIIFDLNTKKVKHTYTFPDAVLSHTQNFLNDIVVDPERGFAYMTDVGVSSGGHNGGLVFYDRNKDISKRFEHPSMKWESNRDDGGYDVKINGKSYPLSVPIDGIALSTDKNSVFYCPIGGVHLYQVMASAVRSCDQDVCTLQDNQVRDMGAKVSESDGILLGQRSLYFAALGINAIYRWDHQADLNAQGVDELWKVKMTKQVLVKRDDERLIWSDAFALDDKGWLWTTSNRIPMFVAGELNSSVNYRIVKVYVNDTSYLMMENNSGSVISFVTLINCCLAFYMYWQGAAFS